MKSRLKKQLSMIMLAITLSTSGCTKNTNTPENPTNIITEITQIEESSYNYTNDDVIYINNYEDYKSYLSELNPSYELLRKTIKNNKGIEGNYETALLRIVDLFEENEIDTKNLAIFYENVKKEIINTDYSIDKSIDGAVGAFFIPDPDTPSITVDGENVDFYFFLHEVIHSCHEVMIRVGDKVIYITSQGLIEEINENGKITIKGYGIGYIEGQTEFISSYLYKSSKHLFGVSKNYNNANDIIDFLYDTASIDFNTFFLLNANDFKNILINYGIKEETVDTIIAGLDYQVINNEANGYKTREIFYTNYIPKLVNKCIEDGYTSKQIYSLIGSSLKTSIIEKCHNLDEYNYYSEYLNDQKILFDKIDEIIGSILNKNNLEVYSIYDFIGHEFGIYYSLYGNESSLDYANLYLAYNWDNQASDNSNILIYVEDNSLRMCNYAKNEDGSLTCYDYNGEIKNINNGVRLSYLTNKEIVTALDGYLRYYYYPEAIIDAIKELEITSSYNIESTINSNTCLYLADDKTFIGSYTINQDGEEIAYIISDNKVYVLPENRIKIGTLKELYDEDIITFDNQGYYDIDNEKLNKFINKNNITKSYK